MIRSLFANSASAQLLNTPTPRQASGVVSNFHFEPSADGVPLIEAAARVAARKNLDHAQFTLPENAREQMAQQQRPPAIPLGAFDQAPGTAYGQPAQLFAFAAGREALLGQQRRIPDGPAVAGDTYESGAPTVTVDDEIEATPLEALEEMTEPVPADLAEERARGTEESKLADEPQRPKKANGEPVTDQEKTEIQKLQQRDREIRAHEMAHLVSSGGLSNGGASFSYQVGPDGKRYAVHGEVNIDTAPEATPEETARKMAQVRRAAMAPANPSAQDRRVAAMAAQRQTQANMEALQEDRAEMQEARAAESLERQARNEAADETGRGGSGSLDAFGQTVNAPKDGDTFVTPAKANTNGNESESDPTRHLLDLTGENPWENTVMVANGIAAQRAYGENAPDAVLRPDTRAAQPAGVRGSGIGMITQVRPPADDATAAHLMGE